MTRTLRAAICITAIMAGTARADVVVPNSANGLEGDGIFNLTTSVAGGRTYQMTVASTQLTGLVGQQINGIQWRINSGSAAWPPADVNFASWDIFVGPGVTPASMSTTFASNFTASPTQVRSGSLTITAGSFTSGLTPNVFGPALAFTTPYLYSGGDLTIELRMAQQVGSTIQSPFDGITISGGPGNGNGVDFASRFAAGTTATTGGAFSNFVVSNLVTSGVPEPSSMALVGASLATVAFWKKRRRRR